MHSLVALDLAGGPGFVDALLRVWDNGDAAAPIDQRLSSDAKRRVVKQLEASVVVDAAEEHSVDGGTPVEPGDALVVATSGSSGEPKGVVLTHDAVAASAAATSDRLGVSASDHWLACLPLSHVGGLSVVTRALAVGTELTVTAGFDADEVAAAVANGANLVSLVPATLDRVDASVFRTIVLGGSSIPVDRPSNTVATYGMTETGSGVVYDGLALDGVDVRVVHREIQLRCPMLLRCYRDGTNPRIEGGWFPTGDFGRLVDGRLYVDGRADAVIITGGENVWPEPVEAVLKTHAAVDDVAVLGRADPEWGERVVALLVVAPDSTAPLLADVRDHVKAELPAWCAPQELHVVKSLPRTAIGKLQRGRLPSKLR